MEKKSAFPGRVIFDHIPKTAGQAINAWLAEVLGSGSVTPNLIGDHNELIRFHGGAFSIISAHVNFEPGQGLDPRYRYVTLIRDPIERIISWLFFVKNNHDRQALPVLHDAVSVFLDSDGVEVPIVLIPHISNYYVRHFQAVVGDPHLCDNDKIDQAVSVVQAYDVVGTFDKIGDFVARLAKLLEVAAPIELTKRNVTRDKPVAGKISVSLMHKIRALNILDCEFYHQINSLITVGTTIKGRNDQVPLNQSWIPYSGQVGREITSDCLQIIRAKMRSPTIVSKGQLMVFEVEITVSREIKSLQMGIHIFDRDRRWAFGVNSTLLKQSHSCRVGGTYAATYYVVADLPVGSYTAGFAFAEQDHLSWTELSWTDVLVEFEVINHSKHQFAGYTFLPARINLSPRFTANLD